MKQLNITEANRLIREANNNMEEVRIDFEGEVRSYEKGSARTIRENSDPGVYHVTVTGKEASEDFFVLIQPPAPEPERPALTPERMNDPVLLLEMRRLDQEQMTKERAFYTEQLESLKREHLSDVARLRAEHEKELARVRSECDYKIALVEGNTAKLEAERGNLSKIIENRLKAELRLNKGAADLAWIDKITENPVAMIFAAKALNIDIKELLPLLMGAGGDISKMIPGMPSGGLSELKNTLKSMGVEVDLNPGGVA